MTKKGRIVVDGYAVTEPLDIELTKDGKNDVCEFVPSDDFNFSAYSSFVEIHFEDGQMMRGMLNYKKDSVVQFRRLP